jgi:hypothetical protein
MAKDPPVAGQPSNDLIIARSDGTTAVFFPDHHPAIDFKRAILARGTLLADIFNDMRVASGRISVLEDELALSFPGDRGYSETPKEQRELEDEIASQRAACEEAAVSFVMIIHGLLERLGKALGRDTRELGDMGANGILLSKVMWALGNRQRHLGEWMTYNAEQRAKNPSIQVLAALGVDALSGEATFESLQACGLGSFDDLQKRVLSIPDAVLNYSGLDYEVSPSGYRISIRIR